MDAEDVSRLRAVIFRLARQLNATSTGEGLTPTQASVLGLVSFRGPLGLADLIELEGLNPTMLSRVVRKLEDDALIRRLPDPSDLRAVRVEITPEGALVNDRIRGLRTQAVSDCLDRLPDQMGKQLLAALPALESLEEELKSARST
ncbi:MarR family winged helix-turn-helix transcriptional regulator [Amycolatopsis alkalitolerans]|nr:MarR family transcriptional regulator [Amycolatopsis alkalitolerans]